MITLYSGTPGSGKSLHLAREVSKYLKTYKKAVIANFPINMEHVTKQGRRKAASFHYWKNKDLTVSRLVAYAKDNHTAGKEGQTLLVIDEAGIMFNARDYGTSDRTSWIEFFMTHRHYGFNIILVAQNDRLIDRQIRAFIEYDVKHRKANNFKTIGLLLSLFQIPLFVAVRYWYGMRERCDAEFFCYRKRDAKLYDTMMLFSEDDFGDSIGAEAQSVLDDEEQVVEVVNEHPDELNPAAVATVADGDTAPAEGTHPRPGQRQPTLMRRVWQFVNKPIVIQNRTVQLDADEQNELQDQGM